MQKETSGRVSGAITVDGTSFIHGSDMWEWFTCPVSLLGMGTEIITNCVGRSRADLSGRSVKRFVQADCSVCCKMHTRVAVIMITPQRLGLVKPVVVRCSTETE